MQADWLSSDDESSSSSMIDITKTFPIILDDDSVDDEMYYETYARQGTMMTERLNEREIRDFLVMARMKANAHKESMSRDTFRDIMRLYELILASCDKTYKRYIIKEYEAIRASYPADKLEQERAFREYEKAHNYQLGFEQQKTHFRNAIALVSSLEKQREWKKEYNSFLTI